MGAYGRHHFVPQFYLRHFAIDERQRQIALYLLPTSKLVASSSIRDQAQRHKLYGSNDREKSLSDLEGAAAGIIRRINERRDVPGWHSPEHGALITHVLFQANRTPTAAEETERANEQLVKMIASFDARLAPHLDQFRVFMDDPVAITLGTAALHQPIMMDLRYKLLVNRGSTPFLTSDHPVILYNQFMERRRKVGSATGLACKGLQVFYPLSPDCCLMLFDYDVYKVGGRSTSGVQVDATDDDVRALNVLQVANAGSQLYFNGKMAEPELIRLIAAAASYRRADRSSVNAYPPRERADGSSSVLLHTSKTDLRVGLRLTNVSELKTAQRYSLGNRVVHPRDPFLCEIHSKFLKLVDARQYKASEFGKFVRDKQQQEAPQWEIPEHT